jgi:hypothetical protein
VRQGRLPSPHEGQGTMTSGPHLDRVEAHLAEHRSETFGMVPPCPDAQHAEEVTDPIPGRCPEVDGHQAPPPG